MELQQGQIANALMNIDESLASISESLSKIADTIDPNGGAIHIIAHEGDKKA